MSPVALYTEAENEKRLFAPNGAKGLLFVLSEIIGRGFMSEGRFYAYLSRMKYINRWALMRNSMEENLCEHTLETAYIAHALGLISNRRCGGSV